MSDEQGAEPHPAATKPRPISRQRKGGGWARGLTKPGWEVAKAEGLSMDQIGDRAAEFNAEAVRLAALPGPSRPLSAREPLQAMKVIKAKPPPIIADERHPLRDPDEYPEDDGLPFEIPREEWPEGYALGWRAWKIWNQPDGSLRGQAERKGWVSVHHGDFQGKFDGRWLPLSHQGEIELGGQVLMCRPATWEAKAKLLEDRKARSVMQLKAQQMIGGNIPGISWGDPQHPSALAYNRVGREMEPVTVPTTARDR